MADVAPPKHRPELVPLLCAALVVGTVAAYGPIWRNDFINYDDDLYVTENNHVQAGLSWESLRWDLTATQASNWHPVTWMSLQLDQEVFGPRAWGYHLTNLLLLHAANAVLLLLGLRALTGAVWRSALVAALFALHPLHVESVAWAAERKDVLSTLFGLLAVAAYLRYVKRPAVSRYLAVALALGLVLGEKLPLIGLAAASSVLTVLVQHRTGALRDLHEFPLAVRAANAVVSYAAYLAEGHHQLAVALFLRQRPAAAVEEARWCVRLDGRNARYRSMLAWFLRQNGNLDEARVQEREAERLRGGVALASRQACPGGGGMTPPSAGRRRLTDAGARCDNSARLPQRAAVVRIHSLFAWRRRAWPRQPPPSSAPPSRPGSRTSRC